MDTIQRPFAWSYSALNNFETCPKKFYHTSIAKDVKDPPSEAMSWGYAVHEAMAKAVKHHSPLPTEMKEWSDWIEWAREPYDPKETVLLVEHRMAITDQMEPCDYFDKQRPVWFRCVADVLKLRGRVARVIDWKTGKPQASSDQLKLTAATIFSHAPEVELITMDFVWLQIDDFDRKTFSRDDLPDLWKQVMPRVDRMKLAAASGVYNPNPSGLCKRHCPVTSCPHHGKGNF